MPSENQHCIARRQADTYSGPDDHRIGIDTIRGRSAGRALAEVDAEWSEAVQRLADNALWQAQNTRAATELLRQVLMDGVQPEDGCAPDCQCSSARARRFLSRTEETP